MGNTFMLFFLEMIILKQDPALYIRIFFLILPNLEQWNVGRFIFKKEKSRHFKKKK